MINKGMNLYIDCKYGVAGDMLTAALMDLVPLENRIEVLEGLNNMGLEGVVFAPTKVTKHNLFGAAMTVLIYGDTEEGHCHCEEEGGHKHHHHGRGMAEIERIIASLNVKDSVKANALGVYKMLAEAESEAHGEPVDFIHFHEVGALDAIADITAVCYLIDWFAPSRITSSPVGIGSGFVDCAHGRLPVPAPATANLLRGIPTCHDDLVGELCTPTGAALVKFFAESFGSMEGMKARYNAYGFGKKDFDWPNCVTVSLGDAEISAEDRPTDAIVELQANLDDMTGEAIGFAMEKLFEAGAADVFSTAIGMKKNRPAVMLTALCQPAKKDAVVEAFFKYTTTIGIRETEKTRYILGRDVEVISTPFGDIHKKVVKGYGVERYKYEYDDLARIADQTGMTLEEVKKEYCNE